MKAKLFQSATSLLLAAVLILSGHINVSAASAEALEPRVSEIASDYRIAFQAVVFAGKRVGLDTAAEFLDHSLDDEPRNLVYGPTTEYAAQILNSSELSTITQKFIAAVSGKNLTYYRMTGTTTLDSTLDLMLAYNNVSYAVTGNITTFRKWSLTITITDTYDFKYTDWLTAITEVDATAVLNNLGAKAQSVGAIVPYDIQLTVNTTVLERNIETNRLDIPAQLQK